MSHNPVAWAPKHKFQLTARLHAALPYDRGEIAIAPSVTYQSTAYTSPTGAIQPQVSQLLLGGNVDSIAGGGVTIRKYTQVNLRFEWNNLMASGFDLAVTGTNLTDKVYITGTSANYTFGTDTATFGPPRMYTVELRKQF